MAKLTRKQADEYRQYDGLSTRTARQLLGVEATASIMSWINTGRLDEYVPNVHFGSVNAPRFVTPESVLKLRKQRIKDGQQEE